MDDHKIKVGAQKSPFELAGLRARLEATQINECLTLNVGGTKFLCSIQLLSKIPNTYFALLASEEWELKFLSDGSVFIDRDPTAFPLILTYLRMYGTSFDLEGWKKTLSKTEVMLLKEEARFYMIPALNETPSILASDEDWAVLHEDFGRRELLFQMTRDGVSFETAINKMGTRTNLMILLRLENGSVIGGFLSGPINTKSAPKFSSDGDAFLIYKSTADAIVKKYPIKKPKNAIFINPNNSTIGFGSGFDLGLAFGGNLLVYTTQSAYEALPVSFGKGLPAEEMEIWSLAPAYR
jgi:hypothetical protein